MSRETPPGLPILAACAVLIYLPGLLVGAAFKVADWMLRHDEPNDLGTVD